MIDKFKNLWHTKKDAIMLQKEELGANFCEKCGRGPLQRYNDSRRSFLVVNENKVFCIVCSQEKDLKEANEISYGGC